VAIDTSHAKRIEEELGVEFVISVQEFVISIQGL
jgi:hypothetical protein